MKLPGFFFSYLIDIHYSNVYQAYVKKMNAEVVKTKSSQLVLSEGEEQHLLSTLWRILYGDIQLIRLTSG